MEDAIDRFIRVNVGSVTDVVEHNIKMAISYRDDDAIKVLVNQLTALQWTWPPTTKPEYWQKGTLTIQNINVHFTFLKGINIDSRRNASRFHHLKLNEDERKPLSKNVITIWLDFL